MKARVTLKDRTSQFIDVPFGSYCTVIREADLTLNRREAMSLQPRVVSTVTCRWMRTVNGVDEFEER